MMHAALQGSANEMLNIHETLVRQTDFGKETILMRESRNPRPCFRAGRALQMVGFSQSALCMLQFPLSSPHLPLRDEKTRNMNA